MAARRAPAGSLTSEDVAELRTQLEAGRRPRVQLSGPQFAEGTSGTVSRIGNPDVEGTDFVTVRVKVNGVTDELAFAPAELSLRRAPRAGGPAAKKSRTAAAGDAGSVDAGSVDAGSVDAGSDQAGSTGVASDSAVLLSVTSARAESADSIGAKAAGPSRTAGAAAGSAGGEGTATGSAAKRRKPAAPKVSFTLTSTGATWALTASRGAKSIAKSVPIAPGVVTGVAELLDQAALLEAVAEINETAWAEAQVRAEQLRAELEELEAVLAAHRFPR
jgi:hypothetical protein